MDRAASMTAYTEFLATKQRCAGQHGHAISLGEVHPNLHPWQAEIVAWAVKHGRAAIWADTGLGKTRVQVEWARMSGDTALIVAPLAVSAQTVREAAKIDVDVRYVRSGQHITGPGVWVTNYEMIDRFDPDQLDAVVLDEACFPAGTLVDTPTGQHPIESLRTGDYIYNAAGIDMIADVHKEEVSYAVRVTIDGQRITVSSTHNFFTQRGWVSAQDLEPGDSILKTSAAMRVVRARHSLQTRPEDTILQSILLSELEDDATCDKSRRTQRRSGCETRRTETRMVGVRIPAGISGTSSYQRPEANGKRRNANEGIQDVERRPPRAFRAWGKWPWLDRSTATDAGCTWTELDSGICYITGPAHSWVSDALQARLSTTRSSSRYRVGWSITSQSAAARREKGRQARFARVDGLEVLEPGDSRLDRLRHTDGKLYFYDLGATRHPSYSVAGSLVHNSILKAHDGKTRTKLIEHFARVPRRLACTATPAPNDPEELTNQAEFLGVCSRVDMLASYFVHDNQGWRLKGHAANPMFEWMASWAFALRRPSDLGYPDDGYQLPGLEIIPELVPVNLTADGQLFPTDLGGVGGRARVRRETLDARCGQAVDLVTAEAHEPWLLWCGLNDEAELLAKSIPGAVNVHGSMPPEEKTELLLAFTDGQIRTLVSKPSICGHGMNWQHCARMAFVGLSDSFEAYYQCIRRCYRYGQTRPVHAHVVLSELESQIATNVARKERDANRTIDGLVTAMRRSRQETAA